ncbi:hypothetical protein J3Q64DRAFT_1647607 [Phycomyces blakesleeanus]|uniref:Peptidase S54 rhomboid domain-containing protein n=1 Tax=Phycomyces blakesleeanus TaxID=4837 RepID=A0ABR3AL02_PHYBL
MNNINPMIVVNGIIGINSAVFGMWYYANESARSFGDPSWLCFMRRNFTASPEGIREGRIHTLFTACISHSSVVHFGVNMLLLHSFGTALALSLGAMRFLTLYAGAGVAGSIASVFNNAYIRPAVERRLGYEHKKRASLGSSSMLLNVLSSYNIYMYMYTYITHFVSPLKNL